MADFGSPVADQVTAPNPQQGIQSLSGILGIAQQQQAIQQGAQQLQVGAGQAQQATQEMNERQGLQAALASGKDPDGNALKNPDGSINTTALTAYANKSLPLTGQGVVQNVVKTQGDQLSVARGGDSILRARNEISSPMYSSRRLCRMIQSAPSLPGWPGWLKQARRWLHLCRRSSLSPRICRR